MSATMTKSEPPQWTISDRVRKARETAGLTQEALANKLGVTRKTVASWEGGRSPRKMTLTLMALICAVPIWWMLDEEPGTGADGEWSPDAYRSFSTKW